jgi:NADPH:quinone reductase-like Zn-dependent oxidoreductase
MKLVERPEPQAAINDVVVQVHVSGFVWDEQTWPSTWTDRLDHDRTPSIPGHELAGVVTALGYGTTGLSVGQRVFGLADWYRDGTLAEYVAMEELPKDMMAVEVRHKEIIYSSRNRAATDRYKYMQKLRIAFANLLKQMPEELRESPDAKLLLAEADDKVCNT